MRRRFTVVPGLLVLCALLGAQEQTAPKFKYDPDWPRPLPNKWKMGGVTGLAVDKDEPHSPHFLADWCREPYRKHPYFWSNCICSLVS